MTSQPNSLHDAGVAYLRAGLHILALIGKRPHGLIHPPDQTPPWQPFAPDERLSWPAALADFKGITGIGIVLTGHLCVVDIDGEEGAVSFQRLTGLATVPETAVTKTSRGLHLWFMSAHPIPSMKLAEKLDLKGLGGYVAAPPSVHPDTGLTYDWLWPLINEHGIVETEWLPEPIEELATIRSQVVRVPRVAKGDGRGSMDGLVAHLERQVEGNRNSCLHWAAHSAREDGFTYLEALAVLGPASGLPTREAQRTIRSAYKA